MLTADEILRLLAALSWETVVPPSPEFPFRVSRSVTGYLDGEVGALQAKLSLMLSAARAAGR